ncbi:MAG: thiamine pyrophosphate-binding protein [Thermomicrobiales bacterium]|nr:thiamine pyrophosphate-binding protein [Thermomicrobiales bacterium]
MTGGQAMVAMLQRYGVDTIFGLPGVQLDGLFSALYDATDDLRVIHTRHEQATAYMADGYARVTGREGVCLVVPGPGLMNAAAGLATAYACNSPVLCLTGQIRSDLIGVGRGMLHEVPYQLEMARSFSKHQQRSTTPAEIPGMLHEAFRQLRSGRPRPVTVEVPPDTFFAEGSVDLGGDVAGQSSPALDLDAIQAAARLLASGLNPVIYGGGGLQRSGAGETLLALATLLQAPIILSSNGRGVVSDREDLVVSNLADATLRPAADVILAIGTRFLGSMSDPLPLGPDQRLIRIDIDPEEITRNQSADVAIVADAGEALTALYDAVAGQSGKRASRTDEIRALRATLEERLDAVQPQAAFSRAMRNALPDDGIVVNEMTQLSYFGRIAFPVYKPMTWITPGYQGTLGYGFTTAMGAKVGKPDVPVLSVNGDGGFGFTLNELSTAAQHNIGVVTVVFNDSAYGNVRRIQQVDLGGKVIASDLRNPDYLKLADAFGVAGRQVTTPEGLQTALEESFKADEPVLIEVPVGPMPDPWKALGLR